MRLKEARAAGEMFYTGKVCKHHPELKGQRRTKSANCHSCVVERMRRLRRRRHQEKAASAVERAGG